MGLGEQLLLARNEGGGEEVCGGDLQSIPERVRGLLGGREAYCLPFAARIRASS